ncbi:unnamed protein product [Urochloa decumbens]|uniref:Uncharacterized protein n=1 Tax=Urochloa decumbens TaxID=240449 RepID=A0ABC8VD58_9POAL
MLRIFPWGEMVVWDWLPIGCRWQQEQLGVKSCQMVQEIVPSSECLGLLTSIECSRVTENSDREACSCWNQEEQRINFGRYDVKRVVQSIYVLFSRSEIPIAKEDIADLLTPLPEWFTEDDLAVYASLL